MSGTLINIGFGNIVFSDRVVAIVSPESAPIKRLVTDARDERRLVDATYGRRTRSVIIMDSDHVVLSALQPETIAHRARIRDASDNSQNSIITDVELGSDTISEGEE